MAFTIAESVSVIMPYLLSITLAIAAVCVEQSRQTQSQFYNEVVNIPCHWSNTESKVRRVVWVNLCASMKLKKIKLNGHQKSKTIIIYNNSVEAAPRPGSRHFLGI